MTYSLSLHQSSPGKDALPCVSNDLATYSTDTRTCVSRSINYACVSKCILYISDTHGRAYVPGRIVRNIIATIVLLFVMISGFAQESWQRISPLPQEQTLNAVTTIPGTNSIIAAGQGSTVMVSHDNAETWDIMINPAGMSNGYKIYGIHFINSNTGFLCGSNESILKTTDGGYTWNEVKSGAVSNSFIRDIAFVSDTKAFGTASEGHIYETNDSGDSWSLSEMSFTSEHLGKFLVLGDQNYVVSAKNQTVYVSENEGEDWVAVEVCPELENLDFLDMDKINDSTIIISAVYGDISNQSMAILRSSDFGYNWEQVVSNWRSGFSSDILLFDNLHSIILTNSWAGYVTYGMETLDGGLTWEEMQGGLYYRNYSDGAVLSDSSIIAVGVNGAIHFSGDLGRNWIPKYESCFPGDVVTAHFVDDSVGYCIAEYPGGGAISVPLYKTTDGGLTWNYTGMDGETDDTKVFFCSPDTGYIVSDGFNLIVSRTYNGGIDWVTYEINIDLEEINSVFFINNHTGYIASYYGLYKTVDSGESWTFVDELPYSFYDAILLPNNEIYGLATEWGSDQILLHSIDGGISWEESLIDVPSGGMLHMLSSGRILILRYFDVYFSDDEGMTWNLAEINTNDFILGNSICFPTETTGYIVCSGNSDNFLKTSDGGETWHSYPTGVSAGLSSIHFWDDMNGIVLGGSGIILRTDNGGATFIEEQPAIPSEPSAITLFPNPATDILNITFEEPQQRGELIFYNTAGTEVMRRTHNPNVAGIIMNVQTMDAGSYVVHYVVDGNIIETSKLIIQ